MASIFWNLWKNFKHKLHEIYYEFHCLVCVLGGGAFYKIHQPQKPKANVVVIHGLLVNNLVFRPMASFLSRRGYNVYLPEIGWNIWSIQEQTAKLEHFWKKQNINQSLPLYILGHSMGGILAHYWITNYKVKPHKLVTLGCPFLGSKIILKDYWYLFPATYALVAKNEPDEYVLTKAPFCQINIAAETDALLPVSSALCDQIESEKILLKDVGGHSGLQINPVVFQKVVELLDA